MSFETDVVKVALKELINNRMLSICSVDKIGKLIGSNPKKHPKYKFLSALHCVHYANMTQEVRDQIPQRVMECLRPDSMNFEAMAIALTREGKDITPTEDAHTDSPKVARLPWRK